VTLLGNGQAVATADLSPASLQFPPQTIGTKSDSMQVLLTNNGDAALTSISIAVTPDDFIGVNNCGPALSGHSTCSFSVSYAPKQIGAEQGVLSVNTSAGPRTVTLSGSGLTPSGISLTPATVDFGSQGVGSVSSLQRITLTNNTASDLSGLSFAVTDTTTGATINEFSIAGSNCPASNVLAANTTCYFDLSFTPSVAGARTGAFTMRSTSLNASWTIALNGTGADFQLQVSSQPSAVIMQGQAATYQIQIIPVPGSAGTVTLTCSGAPENATCSLSPASLSLDRSGSNQFSTITIATSGGSASSASTAFRLWQRAGIALGVLFPCVFFGGRRRKVLWRGWLICFVSLLLIMPAACSANASGGGSSGSGGSSGTTTPSGKYTITITGMIPGLQRSVPLTLTVQ